MAASLYGTTAVMLYRIEATTDRVASLVNYTFSRYIDIEPSD